MVALVMLAEAETGSERGCNDESPLAGRANAECGPTKRFKIRGAWQAGGDEA